MLGRFEHSDRERTPVVAVAPVAVSSSYSCGVRQYDGAVVCNSPMSTSLPPPNPNQGFSKVALAIQTICAFSLFEWEHRVLELQ